MNDDDDKKNGGVISFPPRPKATSHAPLVRVGTDYKACQHKSVEVDAKLAEVTCRRCKAKLNPMHVLDALAQEDDRLRHRWAMLRALIELMDDKTRCKCRHCGKMTPIPSRTPYHVIHARADELRRDDAELPPDESGPQ